MIFPMSVKMCVPNFRRDLFALLSLDVTALFYSVLIVARRFVFRCRTDFVVVHHWNSLVHFLKSSWNSFKTVVTLMKVGRKWFFNATLKALESLFEVRKQLKRHLKRAHDHLLKLVGNVSSFCSEVY